MTLCYGSIERELICWCPSLNGGKGCWFTISTKELAATFVVANGHLLKLEKSALQCENLLKLVLHRMGSSAGKTLLNAYLYLDTTINVKHGH